MTLLELWAEDGLTQRQLVERLDVEQATMANTLARMERDDLITRKPGETDRRSKSIHLTGKAKKLEASAKEAALAQNQQALSAMTEDEQQKFTNLMQRAIKAMKED